MRAARSGPSAAILGMGAITALGRGVDALWQGLMEGRSGLRAVERLDGSGTRWVGNIEQSDLAPVSAGAYASRVIAFAASAVAEALEGAASLLRPATGRALPFAPERIGVCVGTSAGVRTPWDLTCGRVYDPYIRVDGLDAMNGIAQALASMYSWTGPCISVNTACSSGATACGVALEWLAEGRIDLALVCGADEFTEYSAVGFEMMGAYAPAPCSPFSRSDGLTLGEGAGAVALCRAEFAGKLGFEVPHLLGYGLSADAHHPTAPDPEHRGLRLAVKRALANAQVAPDDVACVNLHGTGTPLSDSAEEGAIEALFGGLRRPPLVTANKGAIGHTLGGAGLLELIATVKSLETMRVPPVTGVCGEERWHARPKLVTGSPAVHDGDVAIKLNAAFGGHNSCLVVGRTPQRCDGIARGEDHGVCIAGFGISGVDGPSPRAWRVRAIAGDAATLDEETAPTSLVRPDSIQERDWRRLDRLTQLSLMSSVNALVHAGMGDGPKDDVALLFATERGPSDSCAELHKYVAEGRRPNPALFPRLALTFCAGTLTQLVGLRGPTATFAAGRIGGLVALSYGASLVRRGECAAAVVVATDTVCDFVRSTPKYARREQQRRFCECSIAIVLTRDGRGPEVQSVVLGRSEPVPNWGGPASVAAWERVIEEALTSARMESRDVPKVATASATEMGPADAIQMVLDRFRCLGAIVVDPSATFGDVGAASGLLPLATEFEWDGALRGGPMALLTCQHDVSGLLAVATIAGARAIEA